MAGVRCGSDADDLHSGRNTSIKPVARSGQPAYRFNWETPLLISSHDSNTIFIGGNFVFKSTARGGLLEQPPPWWIPA